MREEGKEDEKKDEERDPVRLRSTALEKSCKHRWDSWVLNQSSLLSQGSLGTVMSDPRHRGEEANKRVRRTRRRWSWRRGKPQAH